MESDQDSMSPKGEPNTGRPTGWAQNMGSWHPTAFSAYCIAAAFGTYFCMYAFRKPFTVAGFEGTAWLGLTFKSILVSSQVAGYTISKFIGIKVISEMSPRYRAIAILVLIAIAEVALFLFAVTPVPWSFIWLFVNGLPLGMVFGLVIGFLEGRQMTEALSAGLCASFIIASGAVKSVGRSLVDDYGVSEYWMPFLTGLIFILPLLLFVWMLAQIPPPSKEDESARTARAPMFHEERKAFFKRHWFGLLSLLSLYIMLTIVRSVRDDFSLEIWKELGVEEKPEVFATSEFWVAIFVIAINGLVILVRNNRRAFLFAIATLGLGFVAMGLVVYLNYSGHLSPMAFMILLGVGMYIPYVLFHTTIFERMIAAFREVATIGYLMYLADAIGYLGYVILIFTCNFLQQDREINFLELLNWSTIGISIVATLLTLALLAYYVQRTPVEGRT